MSEQPTPKLAIVCAGGGTSCAYSGGSLVALAREHGLLQPDYLIAASGSAGSAMYYLTGQYDSIQRIWTRHICSPHFLSFKRIHKMMDVDYLVDTIIRKFEPLDLEKLSNLRTRYFIPVKSARTGQGRYFSCREGIDIHEVLRATKALPFFYGRKVNIGGELFLDSAFTVTKEHGISKALELGATHILVLENNARHRTRFQSLTNQIISRFNASKPNHTPTNHEVSILRLGPDKNPAPPVTRNSDLLTAAFNKGYEDVRNHANLQEFIEPFI